MAPTHWTPRFARTLTLRLHAPNAKTPFPKVCPQCMRRTLSSSAVLSAGHNKWSKIKHDKGAADKKKSAQRIIFSNNLTLCSKWYGADPNMNSQLATLIATAKKTGMPKAAIDAAIARGQGRSSTGARLESATMELMFTPPPPRNNPDAEPAPAVALVVDIETDNKIRAIADLRAIAKKKNAVATPTAFIFSRVGRTSFTRNLEADVDTKAKEEQEEEILMQALEVGADDVEFSPAGDEVTVISSPATTHAVASKLAAAFPAPILELESSGIVYVTADPESGNVAVPNDHAAGSLTALVTALREYDDVKGVFANVEPGEGLPEDGEVWTDLISCLD